MKKKITILLPCLNEEKTLEQCIKKIQKTMDKSKYSTQYDILVCDNGSTDDSIKICKNNKIKYTICKEKGYGNTLINGIKKSKANYLVMLDCDLSYDERDIPKFIDELENGYDFVIGNRFKGKIERKAMPLSHRIGSRMLSEYANFLFHTSSHDYHCGLRAFKKNKIEECNLKSSGFEFASEMIIKSKLNKLKIKEVKTNLLKDKRDRPPHLKTIKDGLRHLFLINKEKYSNSFIFRYLTTFISIIMIFLLISFSSNLIPHKYINKNSYKSITQLNNIFSRNKKINKPFNTYEEEGDIKNFAMIYFQDEKHPIKSMIEMNYPVECNMVDTCIYGINKNNNKLENYSRYWHGQTTILKPLTIFFDINTINLIMMIIFTIIFIYTIINIYKVDKLFSISLFIAALSINIFFVPKSFQYLPVFIIMLIGLNIIKKLYKNNSKYIDIYFFIVGMITCFYDFLTVETITLTMPLLLYLYLKLKNKEEIKYREVFKYILLWGIGYASTFFVKWGMDIIHYGPGMFKKIMHDASIRTWNSNNIYQDFKFSIINNFMPIIPFAYINNGHIIYLILLLITLIYDYFNNKKYIKIYFIVLIPIIRYFVLTFHSAHLYFFTYRAMLPICLLELLIVYDIINKKIEKENRDEK